jgi:hypothetical protein
MEIGSNLALRTASARKLVAISSRPCAVLTSKDTIIGIMMSGTPASLMPPAN